MEVNMDGIILISKIEYFMLRQANEKLNRLERGGVKNWEFYGESLNPDGDNFDDEVIKIQKEIEQWRQ
jgi:hypothetical protein